VTGKLARFAGLLRRRSGAGSRDAFDRRLLAPMMLGSVLNPVNSSIISVSLVPIGAAFGAPPAQTAWLISALYLATAIGQPVMGRLIDLYGPRRLFLAGTSLTGIAGIVGTLAPNLGVLILARVLLGFGTCAGYPAAMYLIRSEAKRTGHDSPAVVLTALSVATQTIAVIGPSLGGLLIGLGGWRTTLALNIPLAAAGLVLGALRLPKAAKPERDEHEHRMAGLDPAGMALFAAMLVSLLLFLMNPQTDHWYLLVLAAGAGTGFTIRELRAATPFIDLRVLSGNLPLVATYARALLAYIVAYAFLYGFTQWMEEGRGLSAVHAGLAQLPLFAVAILVSTTTGRRKEVRVKLLVGATGQIAACALLLLLYSGSTIWLLLAVSVVFGVPQGLNNLALQNSVYYQAEPERMGSSAGLLRTFGYLGAIIASAADSAFLSQRADTTGLHHLTWFMLAIAILFLAVTMADRGLSRVGTTKETTGSPAEANRTVWKGKSTMANTALLVMDVQKGLVGHVRDDHYLPRLAQAVKAARNTGIPIIHVVLGFRAGHPERNERNKSFGALPPNVFTESDPNAAIHPDVAPQPSETVVTKKRVSAFAGSDLELILRAGDINHLVLTGIATSGVVLSTLRQAADLDYRLTVLSDGCTDPDPELHQVLTAKLFPKQADVITIDNWTESLG
jgi:nicotinamidase-related amidase/sugar phosphate permease